VIDFDEQAESFLKQYLSGADRAQGLRAVAEMEKAKAMYMLAQAIEKAIAVWAEMK
jgi:hypothetical protein